VVGVSSLEAGLPSSGSALQYLAAPAAALQHGFRKKAIVTMSAASPISE
jgi:hypothetical protein